MKSIGSIKLYLMVLVLLVVILTFILALHGQPIPDYFGELVKAAAAVIFGLIVVATPKGRTPKA